MCREGLESEAHWTRLYLFYTISTFKRFFLQKTWISCSSWQQPAPLAPPHYSWQHLVDQHRKPIPIKGEVSRGMMVTMGKPEHGCSLLLLLKNRGTSHSKNHIVTDRVLVLWLHCFEPCKWGYLLKTEENNWKHSWQRLKDWAWQGLKERDFHGLRE